MTDSAVGERSKIVEATIHFAGPTAILPAAAQEEWLSALSPVRLRMLALREGVPGIALERAVRAGNPSPMRRDIACEAFERGWGDYARRVALASGFGARDPLTAAAAAAADLAVAARAICASRIHAGSMTVSDARELFRRQALMPGEVASLEARRCATDPCVALELVGRIEIEKLVAELQSKKGFSAVAARDRLLRTGALPFDALRTLLLETGSN
jgi:uncharacterized protein (DUF885 family)